MSSARGASSQEVSSPLNLLKLSEPQVPLREGPLGSRQFIRNMQVQICIFRNKSIKEKTPEDFTLGEIGL